MENCESNIIKNNTLKSNKSWKRHLPHFQLSAGYYFITLVTYNRTLLQPFQKDCIFNALIF